MSKRIEVNDLNCYYGKFLAVEDVSMTIQPRSVTAFIGPSGCGKSTFLRTLNRMHEVIAGARVEGEVLLDGEDLYGPGVDPVRVRRQVGMVFQRPNPFPTMSIKENVLAGITLNNRRLPQAGRDEIVERSLRHGLYKGLEGSRPLLPRDAGASGANSCRPNGRAANAVRNSPGCCQAKRR